MHKFRIAICGTFDIENYGDLIFPELFDMAMHLRGVDCELVRFGPVGGRQPLNEADGEVYKLSRLEAMHNECKFDAIVVGGGALIHFNTLFQYVPQSDRSDSLSDYAIYETWVIPALFSKAFGVPVYWNAPDVPYCFESAVSKIAAKLIEVSDYICVRNASSKSNLLAIGLPEERIVLCPDTALSISRYMGSLRNRDKNDWERQHYIVVHLNRHLKDEEYHVFADVLSQYCFLTGYSVVLLPLANTHGDIEGLLKLQTLLNGPSIMVYPKSIFEMMDIISKARLYVGVSFHGAITALAYGVKAIAYNYMRYAKTRDLYEDLGISELYSENAEQVRVSLTRMLLREQEEDLRVRLAQLQQQIERHFDFIRDQLIASRQSATGTVKRGDLGKVEFASVMIDSVVKLSANASSMRFEMDHALEKTKWLESNASSMRFEMDHILEKTKWLESQVVQLSLLRASDG
ncbi:MAG: polysaccharide pyruvyl transferase family protein [Alphaproteobacteria bacterium]|jgi:polysaccharide pyruvyl transferase WcaK-like protein|nr:polysaccharide pyruvyl transferase family protein [Rhodobacter sp.]